MLTQHLPQGRWFSQLVGSLLGLSFFLSGCITTPPRDMTRRRRSVSTDELLSLLRQRNDYISSLRTTTHLTLATPEEQRSLRASLLVQKPYFIRLEVLNMFMQPVQFFVLNEHNLLWYIPADKKAFKGAPTSLNLYRLLGIRLSVAELVGILLGCTPLPPPSNIQPKLSYLEAEHSYLLQFCLNHNQCTDKIWLNPYWLYGMRLVHTPAPIMGWQVNWGDFEQLQDYYLPTRIRLERPDRASWLELEYDQPVINLPLSQDKFWFDLPPGVETVLLES